MVLTFLGQLPSNQNPVKNKIFREGNYFPPPSHLPPPPNLKAQISKHNNQDTHQHKKRSNPIQSICPTQPGTNQPNVTPNKSPIRPSWQKKLTPSQTVKTPHSWFWEFFAKTSLIHKSPIRS